MKIMSFPQPQQPSLPGFPLNSVSEARFSGDSEGVVSGAAGVVAKCSDGYWWPSPACRDDVAGCSLEA